MIDRILVPKDAKALASAPAAPATRLHSEMDSRTLMPADLPIVPLDTHTNIPAYMPLDVLSNSLVVPRDLPIKPLDLTRTLSPFMPLEVLSAPIAVPKDAKPPQIVHHERVSAALLPEVLEPDVMTTGEVNLLAAPPPALREERRWVLRGASAVLHAAALLILIMISQMMPAHEVSQAEIDQAARSLGYLYLPPDMRNLRTPPPKNEAPSPKMRIDPGLLRRLQENRPQVGTPLPPSPVHEPPHDAAPTQPPVAAPRPPTQQVQPGQLPDRTEQPSKPPPTLEAIQPRPNANPNLTIPRLGSPGNAIQDSVRDLSRSQSVGPPSIGFHGTVPGTGGGPVGGGNGQGYLDGGLQMLTPTEGVDFSSYLSRVLASVRRNWYAIIPESARMGEKGRVVLRFRIMRDGTVVSVEPVLEDSSGKEPLDRAAMSSIRASSPFEPLPAAFSGPNIELRFIFLYNLPLPTQ